MIGILESILCALEKMAAAIIGLLVVAVNATIVTIGALAALIAAALPTIPEAPDIPDGGALGFINFFVPIGPDIALAVSLVAMFGLFMGFRLIMNWLKML